MDKTEFTYQRWHWRIFGAVIALPIIFIVQNIINELLGIEDVTFFYIVLCCTIALAGYTLYYRYTENSELFLKKGYYWVENGSVFIERNNKVIEIKDVKCMSGDTTSAYGVIKVGMLIIKCEKKKYVIYSNTLGDEGHFRRSELYPIFQAILENNPQLKKDKRLHYWYEVEK